MNELEKWWSNLPNGRCKNCKYAKPIVAQDGFWFVGCRHEPYRGKWVAEIKDCPKKEGE